MPISASAAIVMVFSRVAIRTLKSSATSLGSIFRKIILRWGAFELTVGELQGAVRTAIVSVLDLAHHAFARTINIGVAIKSCLYVRCGPVDFQAMRGCPDK